MKVLVLLVYIVVLFYCGMVAYGFYKVKKLAKESKRESKKRRNSFDSNFERLINPAPMPRVKRPQNVSKPRDATSDALVTSAIVSSHDSGGHGGGYSSSCSGSSSSSDSSSSSCSSD